MSVTSTASISATDVSLDVLTKRVALFLFVLLCIDLSFHAFGGLFKLLGVFEGEAEPQGMVYRVVGFGKTILIGGAWLFVRKDCHSKRTLRTLESAGTVVLAGMYLKLASQLPLYGPGFAVLICSMALVLRAALVPSSWRRTLIIGLLVSAWMAAMINFNAQEQVPLGVRVFLVLCGLAFVAVSVVTSRVIYGLHREVSAAQQLGQYELTRKIGEGGMGEVYEATHMLLRRPTAIKLLPAAKVGEQTIARFEREVQQTSRLEHPNSVYIYDYGRTPEGVFYYAMEYLEGLNLQQLVEIYGPIGSSRARHLLFQAAQALAEAHTMELVHRDVKPANIMLCSRGGVPDVVKVLDFGLVKLVSSGTDAGVTHTDSVIGTPHYLSPEAIKSPETIGPAADVYALGAVGYFLLTGREVFQADTVVEVCSLHLTATPEPISGLADDVHPGLEELILRCLSKDARDRPADGNELAGELESLEVTPWRHRDAQDWWADFSKLEVDVPVSGERTALAIDVEHRLH